MAAAGPPGSLWEQICADYEAELPQHPASAKQKEEPVPVVQIKNIHKGQTSTPIAEKGPLVPFGVDEGGVAPTEEWVPLQSPSPLTPELPSLKTCSPREFLEHFIFPELLPGMTELLHQAKKEKCFERKRTKFIALDYLTEWLYNHNPKRDGDPFVEFFEIPFVKEWLKDHPRPPIPKSLLLSEEQAGIIIQSFWRGYKARCEPQVQELREWQKHLRETKNISKRVKDFWVKQEKKVGTKIEDSAMPSPSQSKMSVLEPTPAPKIKEEEEESLDQV